MTSVKRPRFLVRLPFYCLLVALGAVYYGYIISLVLRWLILQQHRTGLAFIFLAVFHGLFGLMLWSLLTTVSRGPGAVGETLSHPSARDAEAGELGLGQRDEVQEEEPLITSAKQAKSSGRRRRTTVSSASSVNEDDDLELRASGSSSEGEHDDASDDECDETETGKRPVIIWPSRDQGADTLMAKANGKPRFCRKCNLPKPDRAHHCSTCGFCILKMDHHCPWIGGCVGFKNYKPFILFLFYALLISLFVGSTSFWALTQVLDTDVESLGLAPVGWGFLVLFGFLFSLMLAGFFPYHLYLSMNNRTTIENMERNGRLLSLPARAESMLAAGTLDPRDASLPEHPKNNMVGHLLPQYQQQYPSQHASSYRFTAPGQTASSNPFLPNSSYTPNNFAQPVLNNFETSATSSLSRLQRRQLEKKAGRINIYDLGFSSLNFEQAFGARWYEWKAWVPAGSSKGNGYDYPVNKRKFMTLRKLNEQLKAAPRGC